MGFLKDLKLKRAQELYEQDLARWEQLVRQWEVILAAARDIMENGDLSETWRDPDDTQIALKNDERLLIAAQGALIEPRRGQGQWEAGRSGVSVRLGKGVRYHVGGTRGSYQQAPEQQTVIDQGEVVVTSKRVAFLGGKYNRDWTFGKLLGIQDAEGIAMTLLPVSNRQKTSGVSYDPEITIGFRALLRMAVAGFNGEDDLKDFVADVEETLVEVRADKPVAPMP